ncbi:lysozyme inhibitor LprI family protein [Chamaesiphon minutus]|uniref:Lysozyme inhibitor LprI-like N-terminal domain-containing protein n=1 Tax=Chamaesiphon minutus (strain ATCC 27169 / PCC 6605) TaxID=1173020 RepID=K9UQZ3_CHAP6|nr:lysozyme inhibitor LprI family protein [Chamaesiphon minutus]AFY96669.1 hypothetical protein Cha6605_5816 [Chamaesiphon minutus PCC 6605]
MRGQFGNSSEIIAIEREALIRSSFFNLVKLCVRFLSFGLAILAAIVAMKIGLNPTIVRAESLVPPSNCVDTGQLALNRCAIARSTNVDKLKSSIYRKLSRQISPRDRARLAITEKTWLQFRSAHCQEVIEPFGNGSMVPLLYHNCLSNVTLDRIADLQHLTAIDISSKLVEVESNNSSDRVYWHRYRLQQCRFEAVRFTKDTRRFTQCDRRLSATRLRQLQEMMSVR